MPSFYLLITCLSLYNILFYSNVGLMKQVPQATNQQGTWEPGSRPLWTRKDFAPRVPAEDPPFTLDDIKRAIPAHCYERPLLRSLRDILQSYTLITITAFLSLFLNQASLKLGLMTSSIVGSSDALNTIVKASSLAVSSNPTSITEFYFPSSIVESAHAAYDVLSLSSFESLPMFVYSASLVTLWVLYVIYQGAFGTGLWVLGHSAGHYGMHASKMVNNIMGLICHTPLLVPYFSWQASHRDHHSHTGDMERDEVHLPDHINQLYPSAAHGYLHNEAFEQYYDKEAKRNGNYPANRSEEHKRAKERGFLENTSTFLRETNQLLRHYNFFHRALNYFFTCVIGWILYLIMNASGRRVHKYNNMPTNHFLPQSPIFSKELAPLVLISTFLMMGTLSFLVTVGYKTSLWFMTLSYIAPYFVVNYWLVIITLLQHAHTALPHFSNASWTYVRGSLSTVDRDFGTFWNWAFYNITDSHVIHHLIANIPHYHALEATTYARELLGDYYIKTDDQKQLFGVFISGWRALRDCSFVAEDDHPVLELARDAVRSLKKSKTGGKVSRDDIIKDITSRKDAVAAKGPHANGRNIEKEVYWYRTAHYEDDE